MIRYIIKQKATGKFLKRTKGYGVRNEWVDSIDDCTLITTGSAASQIAGRFCEPGICFRFASQSWRNYPVEVIKVDVLLIPHGTQPFMKNV
jgi:hypothetical protein